MWQFSFLLLRSFLFFPCIVLIFIVIRFSFSLAFFFICLFVSFFCSMVQVNSVPAIIISPSLPQTVIPPTFFDQLSSEYPSLYEKLMKKESERQRRRTRQSHDMNPELQTLCRGQGKFVLFYSY